MILNDNGPLLNSLTLTKWLNTYF